MDAERRTVVAGVDTHKDAHVLCVLDTLGRKIFAKGLDEFIESAQSAFEMEPGEVELLEQITVPGKRTVMFSEGVTDGTNMEVKSGPLVGRESLIRKTNPRKKLAYLNLTAGGMPVDARVGLRVVRKVD